ncbi:MULTISPECIES: ketopantoate reductase family protein [unclassified Rathayibacter]|uniref:ketopantoate reductase family protein n=1 Tax=unclassified Rathayibacter TaxID=2609250 RepID=UPI001FB510B4|nr:MULTISPECIES: 2-dehydropantoate 2-reductase [unclassified Rathayibacter]MCJ1674582.1 2-dehydropantoate 2-reductase [Rathayibacter sp. VKM Ac-2929]MCJ1684863.1 2-dehydropantoate 2-reductase [Rathayibacter sp. VKM Ac-2928]
MKVCVYGAGAVGGHLAGRLASSAVEVSLIARGESLAAVRENGLRVETREGTLLSHPLATDRPQDLEPQDVVVVAVKAPALPSIAENLAPLLAADGVVLFVTNGVPWWYFRSHGGPLEGTPLPRLDPGGVLGTQLAAEQIVGAVAYTACTAVAPGVIQAENPRNRLVIGRPDGRDDPRLAAFASAFDGSGLEVSATASIRDAVWKKLAMNMIGGSLGVLTASAMQDALAAPTVAALAESMAAEAGAVARALGCDPGDTGAGVAHLKTSHHVQSVVQDLLSGRAMEVDALFRVPLELADLAGVDTPALSLVIELAVQRARAAGLYRDAVPA